MAAATPTVVSTQIPGTRKWVAGTLAFDNAYATNGQTLSLAAIGLSSIDYLIVTGAGGYLLEWDRNAATPKVKAFRQTAATGALVEVPNGTDISAAVATASFLAIGY